jgi:hypothetical protein
MFVQTEVHAMKTVGFLYVAFKQGLNMCLVTTFAQTNTTDL